LPPCKLVIFTAHCRHRKQWMDRMSSITNEFAALLSKVTRPGDFFAAGTIEILAPRLEVDGVGAVALPLLPVQAEQLVAVAERAPYGRGEDTLVDTKVRRTWQIGADRVRIGGKHWAGTLAAILERVAEGLGVAEPIVAELYKLLVYDQGSFFINHRDTEKALGMFATLVVVLPSMSTGGELVVRHKGREVRLDLRCEDPSEAAFAAFYSDCVHEVLPVTAGCRLTLVYNLMRSGKGPKPEPPNYEGEQARVVALLRAWADGKQSPHDDTPEKLIYPLEHAYTPAELGFATLKGPDAAVAGVLVAAAQQSGCDLHLGLVTIEESGAAEYNGDFYSRRRWSESEDDEFEAGEVFDRDVRVSEWRRPDGSPSTLGELPVETEELSPPDALDDLDPDEEEFHEATGNEGASFDRTYRRAAVVLWPRERIFAVLSQAGLPVTLPYLADLAERWAASDEDRKSPLWGQAHELSGHMLARWPKQRWYASSDKAPSDAGRMLTLLTRLGDTTRLDAFLNDIAPDGLNHKRDNAAILGALGLMSPERAAALVERIIAGTAATSLGACGDLLARAVAALPDGRDLVGAATVLVEALPGDPARAGPRAPWQRGPNVEPDFVIDLFAALGRIDAALAERAADHILAWPETYGLDPILVPAVRRLMASSMNQSAAAVHRLRAICLAHLRARIAEPLEAPKDWSRASTLGCQCRRCGELSLYLADPGRETWTFKAAEADRSHLETTIKQARCDLDVTTDRRGRPYSLVCTKNQAIYERRMKQRKEDLANLDQLEV
jgi:predicted 2-oxoglutarate/Fe(II)-dependent dioxygenase YbiX